jgi:hypothetical protein
MNTGAGRVYAPASSIAIPGTAGVLVHTNVEVFVPDGFQPDQVTPPFSGFGYNTPASIACRYQVQSGTHVPKCNPDWTGSPALTNPSGGSGTIAIVDAFDDPWIGEDLTYFDSQFGITGTGTFTLVYGTTNGEEPPFDEPPYDPTGNGGWELEESLDVEYAHAMAPDANIVLVEAESNSFTDMIYAVGVANCYVVYGNSTCTGTASGKGEVIMSWGSTEFSGETGYDASFEMSGVVYFAAAGDSPGVSYPCASPNVVCVGGTTFSRMPPTTPNISSPAQIPFAGQQEGSWELGGGGSSLYEPLANGQSVLANTLSALYNSTSLTPYGASPVGIGISTTKRAVPDVSADANPYTGYWVFDSFQFVLLGYEPPASDAPDAEGWWIVGGTSASNNILAAVTNLAASSNVIIGGVTQPAGTFKTSSAAELGVIYSNISSAYPSVPTTTNFNDILAGFGVCGPYMGYSAAYGWDPCTGVGVPQGVGGL